MSKLLHKLETDFVSAGLVGERINALIVFFVAVSARLPRPLNLTIRGESSAGKNYLMETATRFVPDEHKRLVTGMTPKVLMHSQEDEFQHKAVLIAEYEGVAGADFAIRTFQSEGRIVWEYVDQGAKDGLKKRTNTVKGPAAFIQATTRVSLHPENETRLLSIQTDESAEQTRAINQYQAQLAAGNVQPCPESTIQEWHALLRGLTQNNVLIPYAEQLAETMPPRVRSRRDFPKLLGLIEVSAYLHQKDRQIDDLGRIVANPEDYKIARMLFSSCRDTGVEKSSREFFDVFGIESEGFEFRVTDVMKRIGWKKSKAYQVLAGLEELGCIGPGERRGWYTLLQLKPDPPVALPGKIRISAKDFRISTGIPPRQTDSGYTR
jgi:hypothetical protein